MAEERGWEYNTYMHSLVRMHMHTHTLIHAHTHTRKRTFDTSTPDSGVSLEGIVGEMRDCNLGTSSFSKSLLTQILCKSISKQQEAHGKTASRAAIIYLELMCF